MKAGTWAGEIICKPSNVKKSAESKLSFLKMSKPEIRKQAKRAREIEKFLKESNFDKLYPEEEAQGIRLKISQRCENLSEEDLRQFFKETGEIFKEKKTALRHYQNVRNQEWAIRCAELKPSNVQIEQLSKRIRERIPTDPAVRGYIEKRDGHVDTTPAFPWSFIGGSKDEVEWVKHNENPNPWGTGLPPKRYRNVVFDTKLDCLDDIAVADKKMDVWLTEDRCASEDEIKLVKKRNPVTHFLSNVSESALDNLISITNWAGKGILSHSKASEDERFKEYLNLLGELTARSAVRRLGTGVGQGVTYLKSLEELNKRLSANGDLLNKAQFKELQEMVSKEVAEAQKISEEEMKKFNEEIQKLNKDMLDGLQGYVDKEDDMWKYRVFQMFLILTPIGGFSLFGGVFNYFDPLSQLVGPFFNPSLSFGQGLGGVVDNVPIFGNIAQALGIDTAVSWLGDNLPIVSQLGDVANTILDSGPAQNLMGMVGPAIGSPVTLLGIAGIYSLFRFQDEAEHRYGTKEKNGWIRFTEDSEEKLEKAFRDFEGEKFKGDAKNKLENVLNRVVDEELKILQKAKIAVLFAEFLSKADDEELKIFDGLKFKFENQDKTLSELKKLKQLQSPSGALDILLDKDNNAAAQEGLNKFLAYQKIWDNKKSVSENVAQFNGAKEKIAELGEKQRKEFNEKFVIELAEKKLHMSSLEKEQSKKYEYYLKRIKEDRVRAARIMEQDGLPNPIVKQPVTASVKVPNVVQCN